MVLPSLSGSGLSRLLLSLSLLSPPLGPFYLERPEPKSFFMGKVFFVLTLVHFFLPRLDAVLFGRHRLITSETEH